jgi:hypothetical protein
MEDAATTYNARSECAELLVDGHGGAYQVRRDRRAGRLNSVMVRRVAVI